MGFLGPYYRVKPFIPERLRLMMRRFVARFQLARCSATWPIDLNAAGPPAGWRGWPGKKQFAFVLTHDVETLRGFQRYATLMDIDEKHGFRSAFYLVPEGEYVVDEACLGSIRSRGFEVGVHDLKHDGKLFRSKEAFFSSAPRINKYLEEWKAIGFRAGFMRHNTEWAHALKVEYDASTFDTDPFEPQPDGLKSIYPAWMAGPGGGGYVAMPYTLAQDSTMFLLLENTSIDQWKKKLDWVAEQGGMVLVDTHPDYMGFDGDEPVFKTYPVARYLELLTYVKRRYEGCYWHALPHEVATHAKKQMQNRAGEQIKSEPKITLA
jgi:hypothetical protein